MKWVALAAAIVAAAAAWLWHASAASDDKPGTAAQRVRAQADRPVPVARGKSLDRPDEDYQQLTPDVKDDPDRPQIEEAPEGPIKKYSDEFWERVDEVYSRQLLGFAADCYHGGKDRKQKLKLSYFLDIAGGKVTVRDVKVVDSTLGDATLERCMVKAVGAAHWDDPRMPDWTSDPTQAEHLLIRVETLKRFGPPSD